jgi:glucuronate isomerase
MKNLLKDDRLFSPNPSEREVARRLYTSVRDLPIISPHGPTDPAWFANNLPFENPSALLIQPDHYLLRMLYSQSISMEQLLQKDGLAVWRLFAAHYHLFQGTPSRLWFDHALSQVFGIEERLCEDNADKLYLLIDNCLKSIDFLPRALFDKFNIETLATTESALDDLQHHDLISASDWKGNVITTYRPDSVIDPDYEDFANNVDRLGELTNEDTSNWQGYLNAHRKRRLVFKTRGATATDHGHPSPITADLSPTKCQQLLTGAIKGTLDAESAEQFRAQMLTEMAAMSLDDKLVMQIHPGVHRNHNAQLFKTFGRDKGADLPRPSNYVEGLRPLLDRFGNEPQFTLILFTLDESTYTRDLAPLAGHYPCLKLGPPWWFFDSPEGMLRYKRQVIETAGFYNTSGFNDDTRAFLSIPARHDVSRRIDCRHLAELVCDHRLEEDEAENIAYLLAYGLAKKVYQL